MVPSITETTPAEFCDMSKNCLTSRLIPVVALLVANLSVQAENDVPERIDYSAIAAESLDTLRSYTPSDSAALDTAWSFLNDIAFSMGTLLTHDELAAILSELEGPDSQEIDSLVLATFWLSQGDARTPRTLGAPEDFDALTVLTQLGAHRDDLVRVLALATSARLPHSAFDSHDAIAPEQIAAAAMIVAIAPEANATRDVLLSLLSTHITTHPDSGDWTTIFVEQFAETSDVARALESIATADFPQSLQAMEAELQREDASELALWCAETLAAIVAEEELRGNVATPFEAYAALLAHTRLQRPDRAFEHLDHALKAAVPKPALARALNALGMALVRDGWEAEAIATFTALSALYPDSQLSAYADEHIRHMASVAIHGENNE